MAIAYSIQSKIRYHPQAISDIAVVENSQLDVLSFRKSLGGSAAAPKRTRC
jgi:hypothetical protein